MQIKKVDGKNWVSELINYTLRIVHTRNEKILDTRLVIYVRQVLFDTSGGARVKISHKCCTILTNTGFLKSYLFCAADY